VTKIFKHGEGSKDPVRGVTKKEAKRHIQANARGKVVEPSKLRQAKSVAKDHYAAEADKANGRRGTR
jgi:hypothetical protein